MTKDEVKQYILTQLATDRLIMSQAVAVTGWKFQRVYSAAKTAAKTLNGELVRSKRGAYALVVREEKDAQIPREM